MGLCSKHPNDMAIQEEERWTPYICKTIKEIIKVSNVSNTGEIKRNISMENIRLGGYSVFFFFFFLSPCIYGYIAERSLVICPYSSQLTH